MQLLRVVQGGKAHPENFETARKAYTRYLQI